MPDSTVDHGSGGSANSLQVFWGTGTPPSPGDQPRLPDPPSWRPGRPAERDPYERPRMVVDQLAPIGTREIRDGDANPTDMVNVAIALRRPLLVTGQPGFGKSTLAAMIAAELALGRVLYWPITSRSTLLDGLYTYDAIGHLQAVRRASASGTDTDTSADDKVIGRYLKLGPLGTALLPWRRPRVLLIDEFDKGDIDLPSDLLHVFEQGEFTIRELERLATTEPIDVLTADHGGRAPVTSGLVTCGAFPIVVLTSNGERAFPPAFLRRCLGLHLGRPDSATLEAIIAKKIGAIDPADQAAIDDIKKKFAAGDTTAIDQVLSAIHLIAGRFRPSRQVLNRVLAELDREST
jgi:MoxR-like ATPase